MFSLALFSITTRRSLKVRSRRPPSPQKSPASLLCITFSCWDLSVVWSVGRSSSHCTGIWPSFRMASISKIKWIMSFLGLLVVTCGWLFRFVSVLCHKTCIPRSVGRPARTFGKHGPFEPCWHLGPQVHDKEIFTLWDPTIWWQQMFGNAQKAFPHFYGWLRTFSFSGWVWVPSHQRACGSKFPPPPSLERLQLSPHSERRSDVQKRKATLRKPVVPPPACPHLVWWDETPFWAEKKKKAWTILFSCKTKSGLKRNSYLEWTHECVIDRHHATRIVEFSTIVGCWEKSHQLSFGEELVSVLHHLQQRETFWARSFSQNHRANNRRTHHGKKQSERRSLAWWALHIRSKSCLFRNFTTTSAPNVNDTPRSFSPHPETSLSGSDHNKSHSKPERDC